jgi:hypothetical protein
MPLQAKHVVEELNGTRCTIIEKGVDVSRVEFLKRLLEFNGLQVIVVEDKAVAEEAPTTFTVGVTDIVFHPTIAIYEMSLKTPDGRRVSPSFWEQKSQESIDQYWLSEEEMKPGASAWFYRE